jgi:hypothetical protein
VDGVLPPDLIGGKLSLISCLSKFIKKYDLTSQHICKCPNPPNKTGLAKSGCGSIKSLNPDATRIRIHNRTFNGIFLLKIFKNQKCFTRSF